MFLRGDRPLPMCKYGGECESLAYSHDADFCASWLHRGSTSVIQPRPCETLTCHWMERSITAVGWNRTTARAAEILFCLSAGLARNMHAKLRAARGALDKMRPAEVKSS